MAVVALFHVVKSSNNNMASITGKYLQDWLVKDIIPVVRLAICPIPKQRLG